MEESPNSTTTQQNSTSAYPTSFYVGLHVVGIPLGVAILVGNILLLVVLKLSNPKQQKAFKSKTAFVLANAALCDALGGVFLLIYVGLSPILAELARSHVGCYVWNVVGVVPLLGCFLVQLLLAVERHVIVNEVPNYPQMNKLAVFVGLMWTYTLLVGLLALAFMRGLHPCAYVICDIMTLSSLYLTVVVFVHVTVCTVVCTVLIFIIRNTVKHHQCKIQVSNTIAYTNLIEDSRVAKTFFAVSMATFLAWLPFFICQILLVAGMRSYDVVTSARWAFLFGNISYMKCFCYLAFSRPLRDDFKRTFGKPRKRPFRMGTVVR